MGGWKVTLALRLTSAGLKPEARYLEFRGRAKLL